MQYGKILGLFASLFLITSSAQAGIFEVGASFGYTRSNYGGGSYTWSRSLGTSFGYYFTADSEVQFAFQDTINRTYAPGYQDTNFHDQAYSINMLYYLLEEDSAFRPSVRLGVAQLNRDSGGSTNGGAYAPPKRLDQVSVIGGLGFKVKITQKVAFKAEATSYLTGGSIGSWKDNMSFNFGGAFYF